jgi:hypothetical protein
MLGKEEGAEKGVSKKPEGTVIGKGRVCMGSHLGDLTSHSGTDIPFELREVGARIAFGTFVS